MDIDRFKPYVVHDRLVISDEIKAMTREERNREIARLEEEGRRERDRLRAEKDKKAV